MTRASPFSPPRDDVGRRYRGRQADADGTSGHGGVFRPAWVLAVAAAEMRSAKRLARAWVFSSLSFGAGTALFVFYAVAHYAQSDHSPAVATHPRFLVSSVGLVALFVALAGVVFHAFDVVNRDRRDRMVETLAAKPVTNVELLAGRLAALVLTAWLPLCLLAVALQVGPLVASIFGRPEFGPVANVSRAAFVLIDSLPVLTGWGAVVVLLAVVLRNRLLLAVAAFSLLGLYLWGLFHAPLYLLPVVSGTGGFAYIASDILPNFADGPAIAQRICVLLIASGLLLAAAAWSARPDTPWGGRRVIAASVVTAAGIAGMAGLCVHVSRDIGERDAWAAAHAAKRNDARADLERVVGRVRIDPGKRLELDIDLTLRTPAERLAALALSFNPGMQIEQLLLDGAAVPHEHTLGLLSVTLPASVGADAEVVLSMRAAGVPDPRFAYLDSAVDAMRRSVADSQLHVLGTEASIFAPRYVALMPGVHWLPFPGANHERDDTALPCRDFFEVDIEVAVPPGWLVAGPGRRREASAIGTATRFRFRPDAPVPAVGLFASEFERRTADVAGVQFEFLLHPGHLANFDALRDVGGIALLAEIFGPPRDGTLAYPDRSLTIVEAPGQLRSYGGGWRMDTVQSLPGIQLLREHGLPTAPLHRWLGELDGDRYRLVLFFARYFAQDYGGGDLLHASRNLLPFLTSATGRNAIALDFLVEELTGRVMYAHMFRLGIDRLFSAHLFALGPPSFSIDAPLASAMANTAWIDAVANRETKRATVWNLAEDASPSDIDPHENPRDALSLTMLGTRAVADLTVDVLGRERTMEFLGELRRRHSGGYFDADDILALATDADARLGPAIADWLDGTALPGFEASAAEVFRLTDDDLGRPRYQVQLHVHNGEPTPGWLRLYSDSPRYDPDYPGLGAPIRVGGNASVVLGVLSPAPPRAVAIIPYLSRNRRALHVPFRKVDETAAVAREPLVGGRSSTWQPRRDGGIIVDDLDAGFAIEDASAGHWRYWLTLRPDHRLDLDRGLPVSSAALPDGEWFREERRWSWGRYRRTVAHVRGGDGSRKAVFAAELPDDGSWRLDYHLPAPTGTGPSAPPYTSQGRYAMRLLAGGEETPLVFDASAADAGWNHLGDFALPKGRVLLVVSGRTSGGSAIADAIRWRLLDDPPASPP